MLVIPFFDPDTFTFTYLVANESRGEALVVDPVAGLDLASGDGLLIAKDAADFGDAMLQILEDASLRRDLAHRGRMLAEARLSLHATYENLTEALNTLSLDMHGALR